MDNYLDKRDNFYKFKKVESIAIRKAKVNNALFTIGIPTYKRPKLLEQTLKNALNQQYLGADYIVLIVDNNPERNDQTECLISKYENSNISYYKNTQNIGLFGNWNRIFDLAETKWMIMLHDDDIISPFYLQTISKVLSDDITLIKPYIPKFYTDTYDDFEVINKIPRLEKKEISNFIYGCCLGAPSHMIFNVKKVIEIGGWNDDFFPCSDYLFNAQASYFGNAYYLPIKLGAYRVSSNESTKTDTMIKYFNMRFKISENIYLMLGGSKIVYKLIKWTTFSKFVKDINSKYKMNVKPMYTLYFIPEKIQNLILSIGLKLVRKK